MKEAGLTLRNSGWRGRAADYLALEHNVTIASAAVFLLGFGEELWKKFLPKYLEALGATTPVIGLFGTAEDFFDACYQYPGGFVADRFGRRRAFLIFISLASLGYLPFQQLAQPDVTINNEDLRNATKRLQNFVDARQLTVVKSSGFVRPHVIDGPNDALLRLWRLPRWEHNARRSRPQVCIVDVKASYQVHCRMPIIEQVRAELRK